MSTTMTPPSAATPPPSPPRTSARVVAILTVALGGALVIGTLGSAVFSTVAAASVQTTSRALAVDGVDDLDVDLAAGSLRIEFTDVDEAELEVTSSSGADRWTLRVEDGDLVVASPEGFGMGWIFGGSGEAVLRLPSSLEGLDADLGLAAGDLTASGDFGELALEIGAGSAELDGSAQEFTADVSAGRAEVDLAGVRSADFRVNAGSLETSLTGAPPRDITVEVNAGSLELRVPDGEYEVTSDVSAGDFDDRIGSTPGAASTVSVQVSAGSATLRTAR